MLAVLVFLLLVLVWSVASYLSFRKGVQEANKRLAPGVTQALAEKRGLMLTSPTTILILGTDHAATAERAGIQHSDSILIVRTDPSRHRIVYLSIPRDLRVDIPGYGPDRINVAFQLGGAERAVRTISGYTGLAINHVIVVDFADFRRLIDALGGVDINVPAPIVTNSFDCPYSAERCASWQGYRFAKGKQHMDGRRALVYSRIRENRLNPGESDVTRGARQQQVVDAMLAKITSFQTMLKLPWIGDDLLSPMATDLSAGELMQLGWLKLRAERTIHCRLGGEPANYGGGAMLAPVEENFSVIHMVEGNTSPQPPLPGAGSYAPGCRTGKVLS